MAVLRIQGFSGSIPVTGDRAIDDGYATESVNTWLYGQELRGVRSPALIQTINPGTRKVFRVPRRTVGGDPDYPSMVPPPSYLGDSTWVQFADHDTDVVKGQLVEDKFERYYFCSPSIGPRFNTYKRLKAGLSPYKLGVKGPNIIIAPDGSNPDRPIIASITGGAAPVVTCAYVYTWVNEFGEESMPSLPVTGSGNTTAVWQITNIKDPTPNPPSIDYPLYTKKRLYRTLTGGTNDFYRVAEIALGTTVYNDDHNVMTDVVLTNNLPLESTFWEMPPDTLQGWIAMPNGFLIAFDKPVPDDDTVPNKVMGNNIYMCEPYHWHAWPPQYKYATENTIVGLGIIGQTCVVCTDGYPTTISGLKPASCSFTKATAGEPCLSRGGIVSSPTGVVYPSQNGLILVGPNGIENITNKLITRDEWLKDYIPQYLKAVRYQNGYFALRMYPPGSVPVRSGFFIDPTEFRVALTELSDFENVVAIHGDFWSGEVFLLKAGEVYQWDQPPKAGFAPGAPTYMPVRWKSKEFQYPYEENFGAYAIHWDEARYSDAAWGTSVLPVGTRVQLSVYANRTLRYQQTVPRNGRPVRLPSGFKADIWQFEIRARAPVYSLHVASTVKELKAV